MAHPFALELASRHHPRHCPPKTTGKLDSGIVSQQLFYTLACAFQNPQGPFTDAYISGMSSKRRKLIAETKPPSDVPSLIADGVRQAFHGAGINPATVVPAAVAGAAGTAGAGGSGSSLDELANTIGDDAALNSSYCEAMRASVRERLAKDPDYDAKRFPNCSKYFEK